MARVTRMTKRRLGELLRAEGLLSEEQVKLGLAEQRKANLFLGEALVKLGFVTEDAIASTISQQFGLPFMAVDQYTISNEMLDLFPVSMLREYQFLPMDKVGKVLLIVGAGLMNHDVLDELERISGCRVCQYVGTLKDIFNHIETLYKNHKTQNTELSGLGNMLLTETTAVGKKPKAAEKDEGKASRPAEALSQSGSLADAVNAMTGSTSDVLKEALASLEAPGRAVAAAQQPASPALVTLVKPAPSPAKAAGATLAATGTPASASSARLIPSARISAFADAKPAAASGLKPAVPAAPQAGKPDVPAAGKGGELEKKPAEPSAPKAVPKGGLLGMLKK